MKKRVFAVIALAWAGALLGGAAKAADHAENQLTDQERKEGWKLLFDGKTTEGWREFKRDRFPSSGWVVEDGILKLKGRGGGNILTEGKYDNFDLRWDWKVFPGGNNGVKYFITEERSGSIGHEYQMLADSPEAKDKGSTASFYNVLPPEGDKKLNPPGEWNSSRVLVQGNHVEHWLNGEKVLEYEMGSERVKKAIANSKFRDVKDFGTNFKGHILLTDHGHETWFRNIKIRDLNSR